MLPAVPGIPGQLDDAVQVVIGGALREPTLPLAVLAVLVVFVLVQHRIDRRDPKLATAAVDPEPDLGFGPVLRRPVDGGGP